MAASDQFYRPIKTLHVIFALSSLLMLFSIVWMLWVDHNRPYKAEQQVFRADVKMARAQHKAVENLPSKKAFDKALKELEDAEKGMVENKSKIDELVQSIRKKEPKRDKLEANFQNIKANLVSIQSFYNKAVDDHEETKAEKYKKQIDKLSKQLEKARYGRDQIVDEIRALQQQKSDIEQPLISAQGELKKLNDAFINNIKMATKSEWGVDDVLRSLPVVDGFASPTKISQITLEDIPIDYNFKYVTRFDRCMTCHLGMDDPTYAKDKLLDLWPFEEQIKYVRENKHLTPAQREQQEYRIRKRFEELAIKLGQAKERLKEFRAALKDLPEVNDLPTPEQVELTKLSKSVLTESRVNQFCSHPRQDMFVNANSKHPVEKFGCTSCHRGQGSAIDFSLSGHSPNTEETSDEWKKEHGWAFNHYWDFPMLPKRFVEASCIKCHHEVTDLISTENRDEAPKVVRGYNLIRQNGCFGCHEISGRKYGRNIGPDLRLEPSTPLEEMSPIERKLEYSDPENPPGEFRKVGPSLRRLKEKTTKEWAKKWIRAPREFRPDTRMPHYYGVSNNNDEVLPKDQKPYPHAEIDAIAHYLFEESGKHLDAVKKEQEEPNLAALIQQDRQTLTEKLSLLEINLKDQTLMELKAEIKKLQVKINAQEQKNDPTLAKAILMDKQSLTEKQKLHDQTVADKAFDLLDAEIKVLKNRIKARKEALQIKEYFAPLDELLKEKKYKGDEIKGRFLFAEKGCLSCHRHGTTQTAIEEEKKDGMVIQPFQPALPSDAQFGPDLSQITAKLNANDHDKAMKWLARWIKNPHVHSPRTKMPVVPLTDAEVVDLTYWLMKQAPERLGSEWNKLAVKTPEEKTLYSLADVYLTRILSPENLKKVHDYRDGKKKGGTKVEELKKDFWSNLPVDEQMLFKDGGYAKADHVKYYLGKKAIGRLGCYACHDIPGFDDAKPIGTALNDWGKKFPEKLAFEDITDYVHHNYFPVERMVGEDGSPHAFRKGEHGKVLKPYETYFEHALKHHHREGYLNQKLLAPRSYDHNRIKTWDDRARMPQFRFARSIQRPGESKKDFEARKWQEEAEAREAVMTFVLGLVAEKVPLKSIYQPKDDRLAVVEGRKVLDRFNCAGCHLVQPGVFEFDRDSLVKAHLAEGYKTDVYRETDGVNTTREDDYDFLNHNAWGGNRPLPGKTKFRVKGVNVPLSQVYIDRHLEQYKNLSPEEKLTVLGEEIYGPAFLLDSDYVTKAIQSGNADKLFGSYLRFTDAFRFEDLVKLGKKDALITREFRGGDFIRIGQDPKSKALLPPEKMIYPPPSVFRDPKSFRKFHEHAGQHGGSFANRLTNYLMVKDSKLKLDAFNKESMIARHSVPPALIRQGERTQPKWLFQFLKNPYPIRPMAVLRMPKFNLSDDEADKLVAYFAALNRLTNPKNELSYPIAKIPQQSEPDGSYWQKKNAEYVARLESMVDPKDPKKRKYSETRWEEVLKLLYNIRKESDAKMEEYKTDKADVEKILMDKKDSLSKEEKNALEAEKVKLTNAILRLKEVIDNTPGAKDDLKSDIVKRARKKWREEQAYIIDSFKLLTNSKSLCITCHQVGGSVASGADGQGPNLTEAYKRLRPGWTKHWIANPERMMPHTPKMPAVFQKTKEKGNNQEWFVGDPLHQLNAVTDVLMYYDRAEDMPVIRQWMQPARKGAPKK